MQFHRVKVRAIGINSSATRSSVRANASPTASCSNPFGLPSPLPSPKPEPVIKNSWECPIHSRSVSSSTLETSRTSTVSPSKTRLAHDRHIRTQLQQRVRDARLLASGKISAFGPTVCNLMSSCLDCPGCRRVRGIAVTDPPMFFMSLTQCQ